MEVNAQRERYRILRVNVMTVVSMYNRVRFFKPSQLAVGAPSPQALLTFVVACLFSDTRA